MKELKEKFISGLEIKGWNDSQTEEIWSLILKQADYSFNRGHACSYGLLSYLTAYLKTHYPLYFMTACLSSKSDKVERLSVFISECKRMGIKVSPPNVNLSNSEFTALPEKNEILFGLLAVKGIGQSMVEQIIANRPYSSFNEFKSRVPDKSVIITLIKAGAFPTSDKMKLLKKYASGLFERKQYLPVHQYKSKKEMLDVWGIDVDRYKNGRSVDKEAVLALYNQKRAEEFKCQQAKNIKFIWKHLKNNMLKTNIFGNLKLSPCF